MIQTKTKDKDVIENCLNYCYYYFDKFPTKKKMLSIKNIWSRSAQLCCDPKKKNHVVFFLKLANQHNSTTFANCFPTNSPSDIPIPASLQYLPMAGRLHTVNINSPALASLLPRLPHRKVPPAQFSVSGNCKLCINTSYDWRLRSISNSPIRSFSQSSQVCFLHFPRSI